MPIPAPSALNLTMLVLQGDARDDLLAAIPTMRQDPDGEPTTLGELIAAGRRARPAIGELDGWTLLVDTLFAVPDQAAVVHAATRGRVGYALLWQAASGSHGFGIHDDGVGLRSAFRSDGEWMIDQGEPVPEENGLAWEDDQAAALAELASRLTGIDVDDGPLWETPLTRLVKAPRRSGMGKKLGL